MATDTRVNIKANFKTGFKPTEQNFVDLIDSFLSFEDEGISVESGDLVLSQAVRVGNTSDGNGQAGAIRFNTVSSNFEGHDGSNWSQLGAGGGGGGNSPWVDANPVIHYGVGNNNEFVGIGTDQPSSRLHVTDGENVQLNTNSGYLTIGRTIPGGNNPGANNLTFGVNEIMARRESPAVPGTTEAGNLFLQRLGGNIQMGTSQDEIQLYVFGDTFNTNGGDWLPISDASVKNNIHPFTEGLDRLLQLRPVAFEYNGKGNTIEGHHQVGLVAQEVEEVYPEMVVESKFDLEEENRKTKAINNTPLKYMMINAIKELSGKINQLEQKLAELS